jgi:pyruvate dehydrogenase E2 component (dihydrolipoamide acetyltransferase)
MAHPVVLPQLGESVTEGTVTRWLKNVGDTVHVDEPLVEISTDKVDTEIPAPVSGVLTEITAAVDAVVEVGGQLALIGESSAAPVAAPTPAPAAPVVEEVVVVAPTPPAAPTPVTPTPVAPTPPAAAAPAAASSGSVVEVVLPQLGESVTEGTITRWLKNVGDTVQVDEPLVEISTDKVDTEIPAPSAGVIAEIRAQVDQVIEVGGVLATIASASAAPTAAPTPPPVATPVAPTPAPVAPTPAPAQPAVVKVEPVAAAPVASASTTNGGAYTTPLVRQLAREKGIDLSQVKGSGVGGRIRKEDILNFTPATAAVTPVAAPVAPAAAKPAAAAPAAAPSQLRGRTEPTTRLRRVIAERMVQSLQTSAQLTSVVEVDVTKISALRERVKNDFLKREGVKLTFLPFFAKATIEALKQHPVLNSTLNADATEVTYHDAEHLAIAVDTPKGLLVPVIKDAGDLSIAGLTRKIADVAARTRDNQVTPDELSGGTFTLTNTGSRGALFDTPILNQPQVAIMGTGAVVKRAVVVPGEAGTDSIAVRQMVYLALTYDHRIVDGADAARFLTTVKARLEEANFEDELGL